MTRIHIFKTNRRIKESPFLTACKEQGVLLCNIEMNHYTNVDDMNGNCAFYVSPGENLWRAGNMRGYTTRRWVSNKVWWGIADELSKPGVFDKLAKWVRRQK